MELSARFDDIQSMGVTVVVLTYDSKETLSRFVEKYSIAYTMLSDPDSRVIRQFGIFNETMEAGTKYYGAAYPGVFLVDNKGLIKAKFAEENYRDRPLLDDILISVVKLAP